MLGCNLKKKVNAKHKQPKWGGEEEGKKNLQWWAMFAEKWEGMWKKGTREEMSGKTKKYRYGGKKGGGEWKVH